MIDLHTHSTCSDGTYTPSKLIDKAVEIGLKALALTDHDTLKGLKEARDRARGNLIFINGVEISIEWKKGECHLLGLGVREDSDELNSLLLELEKARKERAWNIAQKLNDAGFHIDFEELSEMAGGTVGRPHFATYMKEHSMVKTLQEAFDKYLSIGRPFYIEKKNVELKDAIRAVKNAGGLPILAHPMSLYRSWSAIPSIIQSFKDIGLLGIEAWHPGTKYGNCVRLEKLAKELSLIITAGSDFHGERRADRHLGRTCGDITIEDFYLEGLDINKE